MNKRVLSGVISLIVLMVVGIMSIYFVDYPNNTDSMINELEAMVLSIGDNSVMVQDNDNIIYTFDSKSHNFNIGDKIIIEYTGILDKNKNFQNNKVIDFKVSIDSEEEELDDELLTNGIFKDYYELAYNKLNSMSLDEKIGQLFLVRYDKNTSIEELKKYHYAGFIFYEPDFVGSESQVKNMIANLQNEAVIPLLTAVDEEGGNVVRASSNPYLADEPFKSSNELYSQGGFDLIKQDTINKSKFLKNLGINLNLAPVVDVSTDSNSYMYNRTIGLNPELTATYAQTVIEASKKTGVSYTLKHFPGYGNNGDSHLGVIIDNRDYSDIVNNDFVPFVKGIEAGAEAILINHNIVTEIDPINPASLVVEFHNILRSRYFFTGIIITDDITMASMANIDNVVEKSILAGNDLIITSDGKSGVEAVKKAINNGTISEVMINNLAFRVLSWKYYKGLMIDTQK